MASDKIIIQISDNELRLLSGQGTSLSVCAHQQRGASGDLAASIQQMFSGLKMPGTSCELIISRREFVLQMLQLPSAEPSEILRMLALQIPRIVPCDETQAIYNYRMIQTRESGYSDVLAAVILNNTLQAYIDSIYAAGLTLSDVHISFDLNVIYARKFLMPLFKDIFCSAVVVSDIKSSEMIVFQEGQVMFSYHLPYGKQDIDKNAKMFALSIKQAVDNYEKTDLGQKIKTIYLDGQLKDVKNITDYLLEDESLEIETIDFLKNIPENMKSFIKKHDINSAWMPLLGYFQLGNKEVVKSFLPKRIHSSKAKKKKKKALIRFFSILVTAILLVVGLCWSILYRYQERLSAIDQKVEDLAPVLENLEAENDFLNVIADRQRRENSVVYKVKEIYQMIPEGVSLQKFSMSAKGSFEIQGVAVKDEGVSSLQADLVASPLFIDVDLQYATKRKRFNKEYTEFKFIFDPVR